MSDKVIEVLRHILDARVDNASTPYEYTLLCDIRDIVEYALADNLDCLRQFDYLEINED